MYNTTAFLYERTAAFEAPEAVRDTVQQALTTAGLQPPGLLGDFGSGTGLIAILMAQQGWQVHGIELSPAMLQIAQEKTATLPADVQQRLTWTQGDITAFSMPTDDRLDAALCLCNTINHLSDWPQVTGFIRTAFGALKPGGVLVLDSDTIGTFQAFFHHGPMAVWDDGRHRMTRRCEFDPATGRARHVALLEAASEVSTAAPLSNGPNPAWHALSEEVMLLQYHKETALFTAFTDGGFQVLSAEPYNPNPVLYNTDFVPKILWVLRKP